ncbi:LysR substrate-binding domain-containing protein [Lichenicola sp.]|uniref:LysR substrate-binding domain-containing protein n=1 Tax=Lichenicola sp. TaxID=2804529 RepID=UPI003B00ED51
MDRLGSMAAFVRAVDLGSFAKAASALDMSPQMVAKHVAHLEARLGTRLLDRSTRRQSLTEIGRSYAAQCRVVLAEAERADLVADAARGVPRGMLRINAPVSYGSCRLVPLVAGYLRRHPGVTVDLVLSDRLVDPIEHGFEVLFRIGPLSRTRLRAHRLPLFRTVACASPGYLAERGAPATPADLADHECLVYGRPDEPALDEWRFTRGGRPQRVRIRGRLRVNTAQALLTAALDGFGIGLIAEDLVADALQSGRLVRVLGDYQTPGRPVHMLTQPDSRQTPKLQSFVALVLDTLGG